MSAGSGLRRQLVRKWLDEYQCITPGLEQALDFHRVVKSGSRDALKERGRHIAYMRCLEKLDLIAASIKDLEHRITLLNPSVFADKPVIEGYKARIANLQDQRVRQLYLMRKYEPKRLDAPANF